MRPEEILGGGFGIVVMLFFFIMAVLISFMPFFIYGTNKRTREKSEKLDRTNKLLAEIRDTLNKN